MSTLISFSYKPDGALAKKKQNLVSNLACSGKSFDCIPDPRVNNGSRQRWALTGVKAKFYDIRIYKTSAGGDSLPSPPYQSGEYQINKDKDDTKTGKQKQ